MAQTIVPFGDPKAAKKWSGSLFIDTAKKSYFTRKFIGTGENNVIQQKTELDSDAGDTISFDLSVRLRGTPTTGDARVKGREENLRFYTDQVSIDQTRKSVSAGGRMSRKRTVHDLRQVAKDRLSDYWSQYIDELTFMYLSGARGINPDFIEAPNYAGMANNAFTAPDNAHILLGGVAVSAATMATTDKMSQELIERAAVVVKMMRAQDPTTANMLPVNVEGEDRYVVVMNPFQAYDLRTNLTGGNWLDIQKAATTAVGYKSNIFMGALGMINNIVLQSHESVIRFSNYGAGANVYAARALLMGKQAGVVAYGTAGGLRYSWEEEVDDYGNEPSVAAGTIIGIKKTRFNGHDFGVLAIDTAAANPKIN